MKNILLASALIFFSLISFSQDDPTIMSCKSMKSADWSDYYKKWIWENPKSTNLTLKFYRKKITVNDEAGSVYNLIGVGDEDVDNERKKTTWGAVDERGRNVKVSLMHFTDNNILALVVMYDDVLFCYYLQTYSTLDRFNNE